MADLCGDPAGLERRSKPRSPAFVTRPEAPVSTRASFVVETGRPGTKPA
ncbi:MAG: hypothetical protein ACR2NV_03105 [Thermoleophilaceae bacterium]